MAAEKEKTEQESGIKSSRLYKSGTNKVIAGICGGLGEFFGIDPTIIRIIFILLTIFGGTGILIYIILWIVIPSTNQSSEITKESLRQNAEEMKASAKTFAHSIRPGQKGEQSRFWWAIFIIILGFLFLFNNLGIFQIDEIEKFWPLLLVFLGISFLLRR